MPRTDGPCAGRQARQKAGGACRTALISFSVNEIIRENTENPNKEGFVSHLGPCCGTDAQRVSPPIGVERRRDISGIAKAMSAENRKYPRRRVLKSGVVIFNNRHSTMDCTVRNLSEGGALLVFARPPTLPDRFSLRFEDGSEFPCRKAWQSAMSIGVAFLTVEAAPPPAAPPPAPVAEPKPESVEVRIGGTVVYATGADGGAAPALDAERKAQVLKALADAIAQIGAT